MQKCPCGYDKTYDECCGVFITNKMNPETPEQLMRSRYSAYALANIDYIMQTMKSPAADFFDVDDAKTWAGTTEWLKLEVLKSSSKDDKGWVEFIAHFREGSKKYAMHEMSEFHKINGKWYYVQGKPPTGN